MNFKFIYIIILGCFVLVGCNDFLDESPDNRTSLDSPKKITQVLVNAYPGANYAVLAELSADNLVDNRAPNAQGVTYNVESLERIDDEAFAWDEVQSYTGQDSPYYIWARFYHSIATVNHALEAIEKLKSEGVTESMDAQKGEALILRAYCHFVLANMFCKTYKDSITSQQDLGIPYVTEPETDVNTVYERGNVAQVYKLIQKDIEEGLPLITDDLHSVPKYHFTTKSANAFAARFYLYKRDYAKVVEHANAALGGTPYANLRNWNQTFLNADEFAYAYIGADEPANLLLMDSYAVYWLRFVPDYARYGHNGTAYNGGIGSAGPNWSGQCGFFPSVIRQYNRNYGVWYPKVYHFFEYTDKVALVGFYHHVKAEFTTDAVLLDRAEAYIYLDKYNQAVDDLAEWSKSHKNSTPLTEERIRSFYVPGEINSLEFHTTELSPQFVVTEQQKPLVDCVLHFRRIERLFDGDRWFDIKRYGIELTHYIGNSNEKRVLTYDDDRRALQIPADVLGAGLEANPRETNTFISEISTPCLFD